MSSSRLPQKVLKPILGKPMLLHEVERLRRSKFIDKLIIATSTDASDDPIAALGKENNVEVFHGNLEDVLDRYYCYAARYSPDHVVRVTGDCPVIDWRIVDRAVKQHLHDENDYTSLSPQYPDGLDTEVIRFAALKEAWENAVLPSEREHVTPYIRNNADKFRIGRVPADADRSAMRWTVDELRDFTFISKIYEELYPQNADFSTEDILSLLAQHADWLQINAGIVRNEGLLKSLAEDKAFAVENNDEQYAKII